MSATIAVLSNLLTSSRLHVARRCLREHRIMYELGYRPAVDADELAFGTLIHKALEAWWKAKQAGLPAEQWLELALAALRAAKPDPFDLVRAEVMISGYDFRWANEPLDVLAVEVRFETELVNPTSGAASRTWRLGGKIDVVVRDQVDGLVKVIEHKTSSEDVSPGSDYWKRLKLDGQVSVYFDGAASLGYDVAACIYDVLGKPGQRPYKATPLESHKYKANGELYANQRAADETPEEFKVRLLEAYLKEPERYYARNPVVRLEAELAEARADVWELGRIVRDAQLAGRAPRNPDCCVRYGRTCPFFGVCVGEASLEDQRLFRRSTDVHPELAGDVVQPQPAPSKEETSNDSRTS